MFFLPGYVNYFEKNGAIFITSKLRRNTVKLTDSDLIQEFFSIVERGYCTEISTILEEFLHEQELLANKDEINRSIEDLLELMQNSLILTMMPTEGCNFRCPYCYEDHSSIFMHRNILHEIQKYITVQAPNFKQISVGWFGGEPTLCKDTILETSELIQSLQVKHQFKLTSSMTTNGYLLSPEDFQKYYHSGITSYQITLDGWNHDRTRPHVSGKGTLQRILDNLIAISTLSREDFQYQIILHHNILPEDNDYSWYDYLQSLFGQDDRFSILVRPVSNWGGNSVQSLKILKGQELSVLLQSHINYLKGIGLNCKNSEHEILSRICYASYPHSMVFRANGQIEKCTVCLGHSENILGHIIPGKGLILDERINKLWSDSGLKAQCYRCSDLLSCLNMQCRMSSITRGENPAARSCIISSTY